MDRKLEGVKLEAYIVSGMGIGILLGFLAYFSSRRFLTQVVKPKVQQYLGTLGIFLAAGVWVVLDGGKNDDPVRVFIAALFFAIVGTYSLVMASFAGK